MSRSVGGRAGEQLEHGGRGGGSLDARLGRGADGGTEAVGVHAPVGQQVHDPFAAGAGEVCESFRFDVDGLEQPDTHGGGLEGALIQPARRDGDPLPRRFGEPLLEELAEGSPWFHAFGLGEAGDAAVERLHPVLAGKHPDAPAFTLPARWDTAAMLRVDLEAARAAWIAEGATAEERHKRGRSDYLAAEDAEGRRVDFHALRTTGSTLFERAGLESSDICARRVSLSVGFSLSCAIDRGRIRTCDLLLRRQPLYPAELRGRVAC